MHHSKQPNEQNGIRLPLYLQFKKQILSQIQEGQLRPGDMIPAERDLCIAFAISRTTVRQALLELVNEGYLYRRQGQGSFVASQRPGDHGGAKGSLEIQMTGSNHTPGWKLLGSGVMLAPALVAERLKVARGAPVFWHTRLRTVGTEPAGAEFAGVEPVGLWRSYLPKAYRDLVRAEGLTSGRSWSYLSQAVELADCCTERIFMATGADEESAQMLGVDVGAPLLVVERVIYDPQGQPVEYGRVSIRPEWCKYRVVLPNAGTHWVEACIG